MSDEINNNNTSNLEDLFVSGENIDKIDQNSISNTDRESDLKNSNLENSAGEEILVATPESLEDRIETAILEEAMQDSYLKYAMSVIVSRALPDVRDGLKPVHRRILYTMYKMGLTPGAKYVKSARVVGEVLGKYHPHGDQSVYNSLARLSQDYAVRYPLIDGQGNFGSIDGDSPAAMRYTECRLQKPSVFMLNDIDKDTVDFVDNYDASTKEPKVLPTVLPNLIVNGQTGIAVGMATEIPPHNIKEVVDSLIALLDNPELTIEELMQYIPGPDLPTGGIIYGRENILSAYKTGRGKCIVRSKTIVEDTRIIVNEIPYQVNKADLITKIAQLVHDKKIEGIKDIRDESNKEGIRIIIELKRDSSGEIILNQLFKLSDLQTNIHFNLLALVNDGRQPKLLNLKEILVEFLNHRDEVVVRRTNFELKKAKEELHILEGLKIALDNIDRVISIIRSSYDKEEASKNLQKEFDLSPLQSEAILQMRLQTLTNLDKSKIEKEREEKIALIAKLEEILNNSEVKKALIKKEILELTEKIKSLRKTKIFDYDLKDYNKEDFISDEEVLVQMTNSQYIKVLPLDTFRQQGRGGRGVTSFNPKDEDWVKASVICQSHDYLYAFTNFGRVFKIRVFDLPSGSRQGRGQYLVNFLNLMENEKVTNILPINKNEELDKKGSLIFATKKGLVKKTALKLFENIRKTGIIACNLNEGDEIFAVQLSNNDNDKIVLSGSNGKTVIFSKLQLSNLGRTAKGVRGMKLKKDDYLISLQISDNEFLQLDDPSQDNVIENDKPLKVKEYPSLLVITENGYGKQTKLSEFRQTNRATSGVKTLNLSKKTGRPVLVQIVYGTENSMVVTTKNGITIRISPEQISQLGRNTQGIKIIKLEKKDLVISGGVV